MRFLFVISLRSEKRKGALLMKNTLRYGLIAALIFALFALTALAASAENFTVYPSEADAAAGTNAVSSHDLLSDGEFS